MDGLTAFLVNRSRRQDPSLQAVFTQICGNRGFDPEAVHESPLYRIGGESHICQGGIQPIARYVVRLRSLLSTKKVSSGLSTCFSVPTLIEDILFLLAFIRLNLLRRIFLVTRIMGGHRVTKIGTSALLKSY